MAASPGRSCSEFAANNDDILQDTSDTCVNFALDGGCDSDAQKASTTCRASCHIQRFCSNHTETVTCSKALRCEGIMDKESDCVSKAKAGQASGGAAAGEHAIYAFNRRLLAAARALAGGLEAHVHDLARRLVQHHQRPVRANLL